MFYKTLSLYPHCLLAIYKTIKYGLDAKIFHIICNQLNYFSYMYIYFKLNYLSYTSETFLI